MRAVAPRTGPRPKREHCPVANAGRFGGMSVRPAGRFHSVRRGIRAAILANRRMASAKGRPGNPGEPVGRGRWRSGVPQARQSDPVSPVVFRVLLPPARHEREALEEVNVLFVLQERPVQLGQRVRSVAPEVVRGQILGQ